jgi:16S rRNA (guanine1516-N2)-methyltransferase
MLPNKLIIIHDSSNIEHAKRIQTKFLKSDLLANHKFNIKNIKSSDAIYLDITNPIYRLFKYTESGIIDLAIDFDEYAKNKRINFAWRQEMLLKAIGPPNKQIIIDATTGFARDAFLMASRGFKILMFEKNPLIYLLIENALTNCETIKAKDIIMNMQLIGRDFLKHAAKIKADIIYLDMMFPKNNKNAKVKKEMQLLQYCCPAEDNIAEMLTSAYKIAKEKVILKRPLNSELDLPMQPNYVISGSKISFNIFKKLP